MGPAKRARAFLTKKGLHQQAKALDFAVCGGASVGERFGWLEGGAPCKACGAVDTWKHRYYFCRQLKEINDPLNHLDQTAWLVKEVDAGIWNAYPCMVARGLVPNSYWNFQTLSERLDPPPTRSWSGTTARPRQQLESQAPMELGPPS